MREIILFYPIFHGNFFILWQIIIYCWIFVCDNLNSIFDFDLIQAIHAIFTFFVHIYKDDVFYHKSKEMIF